MTTPSPSPLRIGIIGCGHIANQLVKAARAEHCEPVACCSRRRETAEAFARTHALDGKPIAVEEDATALVRRDDVELIMITTPPDLHAAQTELALQAGKPVLCEKPSALHPDDDQRIAELSDRLQLPVACFSSRLRYGGFTSLAKETIRDGRLGKIYRVEARFVRPMGRPGIDIMKEAEWFTDRQRSGGGVLADMGCYLTDQLLYLLDWPRLQSVDATTFRGHAHALPEHRIHDVEEQASLFARLEGGITLTLDLSGRSHEKPMHRMVLLGSRAGLRIEHDEANAVYSLMQIRPGEEPKKSCNLEETAKWNPAPFNSRMLFRQFREALRHGAPPPGATPHESRRISELVHLAYQSAESETEIQLNPTTP